MSKSLTSQDFERAAKRMAVSVAHIRAVNEVESNGNGFLPDGRVKVQYEPHIMHRRLRAKFGEVFADKMLAQFPDLVAIKAGSYQSADKEDKDMDRAVKLIDRDCALESASWGAYQIMGYHWKVCGFVRLQDFVNAMQTAGGQLDVFVRFVLADSRLWRALREKDWRTFAEIYNGSNYKAFNYDVKIAAAYKRYEKLLG